MNALTLAHYLDRVESRVRRLAAHLSWPQAWLREFLAYLDDPRMEPQEFWCRYTLKRIEAEPRFTSIKSEADALAFYRDCDYPLWRNVVHRRHSAWRRVLWTMRGRYGRLLEYGCGIAPVSSWLRSRKPGWRCVLEDVPGSRTLAFARSRVPFAHEAENFHVITALDVFEHLADPESAARSLVGRLAPRGVLHWNFIAASGRDLDLATAVQRDRTIRYLRSSLTPVWERDGYRVMRKP